MVRVSSFFFFFFVVAGACAPLPPSDECRQYVSCQAAYDDAAGLDATDTVDYDRDGQCWETAEFAEACDADCVEAVDALRAAAAAADLRVEECDVVEGDG